MKAPASKDLNGIIEQVNATTDSLFENVSKCDEYRKTSRALQNVTRSVQDISRAVEESAVAITRQAMFPTHPSLS